MVGDIGLANRLEHVMSNSIILPIFFGTVCLARQEPYTIKTYYSVEQKLDNYNLLQVTLYSRLFL